LAAQEAHTVPGVTNKGYLADFSQSTTHTIAMLCLHKPWLQQKQSLEPLYLGEMMNPPLAPTTIRTPSTLETPLTSLLEEHQEGQEAQTDLEALEDPMAPEEYPSLISSPSSQVET